MNIIELRLMEEMIFSFNTQSRRKAYQIEPAVSFFPDAEVNVASFYT